MISDIYVPVDQMNLTVHQSNSSKLQMLQFYI